MTTENLLRDAINTFYNTARNTRGYAALLAVYDGFTARVAAIQEAGNVDGPHNNGRAGEGAGGVGSGGADAAYLPDGAAGKRGR